MGKKSEITQQKILSTARELFLVKGYHGVKMQELADKAGVNKGLLHHYFKNKDTLFKAIFAEAFHSLLNNIIEQLDSDLTLEKKFDAIIDAYFETLTGHSNMPLFVLSEMNRNPKELLNTLNVETFIPVLIEKFSGQLAEKDTRKAAHILISMVSLIVFPFVAKPIIEQVVKPASEYDEFMKERKVLVKSIVFNLLKTL